VDIASEFLSEDEYGSNQSTQQIPFGRIQVALVIMTGGDGRLAGINEFLLQCADDSGVLPQPCFIDWTAPDSLVAPDSLGRPCPTQLHPDRVGWLVVRAAPRIIPGWHARHMAKTKRVAFLCRVDLGKFVSYQSSSTRRAGWLTMVQHQHDGDSEETILYLAEQWPGRHGEPLRITKHAKQVVEIEDDDG
jgi:hypothetical protein